MSDEHNTTLQRVGPGHYRHIPSGFDVVQRVRSGGAWRVLDGGGHQRFIGPTLGSARRWLVETTGSVSPDATGTT